MLLHFKIGFIQPDSGTDFFFARTLKILLEVLCCWIYDRCVWCRNCRIGRNSYGHIRCFDFPKLYSSKVFVFIVQTRYWLTLFRQSIASMYNKNKHLGWIKSFEKSKHLKHTEKHQSIVSLCVGRIKKAKTFWHILRLNNYILTYHN